MVKLIINPAIPNPLPLLDLNDNEPNITPKICNTHANINITTTAPSEILSKSIAIIKTNIKQPSKPTIKEVIAKP
ncbi:hypothetical protein D3C81_2027000 [compost metagenome]